MTTRWPTPALTDPVIIDGHRYRIREIQQDGSALVRTAYAPRLERKLNVSELVWDREARLWRLREAT